MSKRIIKLHPRNPPLCSHLMAGLYFAESIKNRGIFLGIQCDNITNYWFGYCSSGDTEIMGERTKSSARGLYFVKTADKPPFALN